jgi:AcrR family transcriptional regulator
VAIAAHVEVLLEIGNYTAASPRITSQVPEAVRERRIDALRDYSHYWRDLVSAALADGQVRSDLDRSVVRMLVLGGMNAAPAWFRAEDAALSAQALPAQFVTVFLDGIARVRGTELRDVTVELAAVTAARSAMATAEGEDDQVTRRILDAAATVFAEHGYSGARLADVAEAAGVKEATFYHHFASREELVVAFLDSAWGRTSALVSASLDALPSGSAALTRFVTAMVAHLVSILHDDFYPAAWATIVGQLPDDVRAHTAGAQRSLISVGGRLYEAAVAAGEVRDDLEMSSVLMTLAGTLNWVADWYQPGARLAPEELAAHFTTLVLDGFAT